MKYSNALLLGALAISGACSSDNAAGDAGLGGDASLGGGGADAGTGPGRAPSCDPIMLQAQRAAPDILIVLDRSTSMRDNDSNTDRWQGSVNAVNTVVAELEDRARFGLMTFPNREGGGGGWGGGDQCSPGGLDVGLAPLNAAPIADFLGNPRTRANGYTPTAQTLEQAGDVMAEIAPQSAGEFNLSKYVLLVTDGDPNCFSDQLSGDTEAQQASIVEVENLTAEGVTTYVVGFQTGGTPFAGVLDQMAAAGGTGETMHRSVNSGDELLEELTTIAAGAVSCSFVLAQKVDESRVNIWVDGVEATYGDDWDLLDDGQTVELRPATCEQLQNGATVTAEVVCESIRLI